MSSSSVSRLSRRLPAPARPSPRLASVGGRAEVPGAAVALNPAARLLWRTATSVQFELGEQAVILDGIDEPTVAQLIGHRQDGCAPTSTLAALQATLKAGGYLQDRPDPAYCVPPGAAVPERLLSDFAALSERSGGDAADVRRQLAGRRMCAVVVHGPHRIAAAVGAVLAAAGVGRVHLPDGGDVRLAYTMPGGLTPADEGRRLLDATGDAIRRAAPEVDTSAVPADHPVDLVLLTGDGQVDSDVRAGLHSAGIAHLLVGVHGSRGVVGPLVIPGVTTCLRCVDLHRRDRDPAWPALAAQLSTRRRRTAPSDVALCSLIAGLAAAQALSHLDGEPVATAGGSLHVTLPGWQIRRRSFAPHPGCDCAVLP